jgi:eukaryotic-like serine/threonine-protein kinase
MYAEGENLPFDADTTKTVVPPSLQRTDSLSAPRSSVTNTELRRIGSYQILRRLGEGGMGAVYLAYEEGVGRQLAIKVLSDQLADNQTYIERFYREARSVAQLDHPNIVHFHGVGRDRSSGCHYLALEYVDGPSAHALLQRDGKLAVGDAVHIVLDVARALEHAHSRSIVHRDIKPDNILLTRSGVAKLADLGLAKRTDEVSSLTGVRQSFGTPFYMPYEQAVNAKEADGRSDIYALGATLYHLVTGEVPFPGNSPLEVVEKKSLGQYVPASTFNPAVPEALDRVLARMLARSPADRYQTASELIVDLERYKLASAVPSFADPEKALQDPVVQARLAPPQPTQPDLRAGRSDRKTQLKGANVWFVRYQKPDGRWCKAHGTTKQLIDRLRDGRISRTAQVARDANGVYRPLSAYPEFASAAESAANAKRSHPVEPMRRAETRSIDAAKPSFKLLAWIVGATIVLAGSSLLMHYFALI